jgi:hypothetical protein
MTMPGSHNVAQRRFWNMLAMKPGIIHIGSWDTLDDRSTLRAGFDNLDYPDASDEPILWYDVYTGSELRYGPLEFPPEFKLARYWQWRYESGTIAGLSGVDYNGTNEWILKPYSEEFGLVGGNAWQRGSDWDVANLFYDASPFAIPTSLHYDAKVNWNVTGARSGLAVPWVYDDFDIAVGWGQGGYLYGYLDDHYFGNNETGGDKPSEGIGPRQESVGDLSKSFAGLWGNFGLSHGILVWDSGNCVATWTFDVCDRPYQMFTANFNNQIYHQLETGEFQSEGWGTDIVQVVANTVEHEDGSKEDYLQFSTDVSPSRSTLNVYDMEGQMLTYGEDYVDDPCDRSGRSKRLVKEPVDPCKRYHTLIVTYLVTAQSLESGTHPGRTTETNVGHDRQGEQGDIRGL